MKFLAYDSPFMVGMRRIVDYALLGMLWILASIPVFTFGAATTAALQTAEKAVREDEGHIFKNFCQRFKREFKQATLLWLLELPILAILVVDILLVWGSSLNGILQGLIYVATAVVFCWIQLWFGYLSKFEDKTKTLLTNTFRMMLGSFGRTFFMGVLALVCLIAVFILFILMPPIMMLIPGFYLMAYTALLRKLVARYIPKDEEEQETEAEAPALQEAE